MPLFSIPLDLLAIMGVAKVAKIWKSLFLANPKRSHTRQFARRDGRLPIRSGGAARFSGRYGSASKSDLPAASRDGNDKGLQGSTAQTGVNHAMDPDQKVILASRDFQIITLSQPGFRWERPIGRQLPGSLARNRLFRPGGRAGAAGILHNSPG